MPAVEEPETAAPVETPSVLAPEDLAEVIRAYSDVAERLQNSHVALQGEVERLRSELARKNEQLERSKRLSALGEMAAGIAHEIRNPLAAIQLYIEMVGDDLRAAMATPPLAPGSAGGGCDLHTTAEDESNRDPGQSPGLIHGVDLTFAHDHSLKIADAVRGLSAIVNDVLAFARRIEPIVRPLNPVEVVQRVIDANRPALEAQGIAVQTRFTTDTLHADPDLLHRALVNLVRNAAEAMAGRAAGRLSLRVNAEKITVADTGPGLPEGVIDRIFNPFFTTRNTGTGLGLAIVHRIVDAHGGSIAVHNDEASGGAVFTLELPHSAESLLPAKDAA
jgi:signal transduction histidine kinase